MLPSYRVSRQIATSFTAWSIARQDCQPVSTGLLRQWLKPKRGKDVKTPSGILANRDHAVNDVAIQERGCLKRRSLFLAQNGGKGFKIDE